MFGGKNFGELGKWLVVATFAKFYHSYFNNVLWHKWRNQNKQKFTKVFLNQIFLLYGMSSLIAIQVQRIKHVNDPIHFNQYTATTYIAKC